MEKRKLPPRENKLFLLYAFHRIGAMTNQQALRFITENELMDYMDFQLSLAELTDGGLMQVFQLDDNRYYTLTSRGEQMLAFFARQIPASRRDGVDGVAERWRKLFHRERTTSADYARKGEGGYVVRLTEREGGSVIADFSLHIDTLEQAKKLCARWEERSNDAFEALVMALLADEPSGEIARENL